MKLSECEPSQNPDPFEPKNSILKQFEKQKWIFYKDQNEEKHLKCIKRPLNVKKK